MQPYWDEELRFYLTPLMILGGTALAISGLRAAASAVMLPATTPGKNLRLMTGFRAALVGAAIACAAAGWLWQVEGLAVAAMVIGLGELLETSLDVWALRREATAAAAGRGRPSGSA